MIVIDTSVLIDALHGKEIALRKILELEETGETLCTTQINVLEFYKGAYSPARSETGLEKVKKLLEALVILSIDEDTYEMFGELSAELRRRRGYRRLRGADRLHCIDPRGVDSIHRPPLPARAGLEYNRFLYSLISAQKLNRH